MYLNDFFTVPMSLAGIPAISIPAGLAAPEGAGEGAPQLPVGFQIAAPAFGEQKLLEAAHALEGALGFAAAVGDAAPGREAPVAELEAVIGLEIHVQLATRTKMFCGCELSFGDEPNVHTCPICLAHPGVLPVPNEEAIRFALKIGLALGCEIAPRSIFHRKNYFYPDNPKAYQISQYDIPICGDGQARRHPHHPRPPRGGRGEDDPRRRLGPDPRLRPPRWSTSTAAARRWSRSSPSPTCAAPPKRPSGRACCARRCASSASPT